MSAYIKTLKNTDGDIIYPQTKTSAVYTNEGVNIESIFGNPALIDGSAPIIDTTMSVNADTLQGKNWNQMLTNRNLLDNWDFRNPVNQRGKTSTSTSMEFVGDRWRMYNFVSGSATLSSAGLTLTGRHDFGQALESTRIPSTANIPITMSAMLSNGTIVSKSFILLNTGEIQYVAYESTSPAFKISFIRNWQSGIDLFHFTPLDSTVTFVACKLELGSVSTLANDPPADYGEELRKCQRYYFQEHYNQYETIGLGYVGGEWTTFTIGIGNQMRLKNPATVMTGSLGFVGAQPSATISAVTGSIVSGTSAQIGRAINASTQGACYVYPAESSGVDIKLSADL